MATLQPTIERRQHLAAPLRRVSWGAIFAGGAIATATMVLLGLLGLAVGATVIEPDSRDWPSARAFGIGAGLWWLVSGILALFAGGWSAGRLAGLRREWEAPLHGLVTWAVAVTAIVILMGTALGAVVSGALQVVSKGATMAGLDRRGMEMPMDRMMGGEEETAPDRGRAGAVTEREAREAADDAADAVATAAWWTCLYLLLTAIAAGAGARLGVPRPRHGSMEAQSRAAVTPNAQ